ncbi:glycosyltransferase [Plectonema cf. radiosum LEGE 06105]|uniref:Glycosyltransferase n=1 Tax=Plectonema cf. radiosum LEGE 06105 TaxID=945769 RepID=A0A8J7EZH6_9CYAN|nr:glycosyltransferase family 4 protein [Plectonema radiosum]MBE9212803.1 glycosyltransferase [Plectonema cf. radiosum LEGE 06105]
MGKRLLIVSNLDSSEPFGAFTRPFYLGQYLVKYFDVCQLGLDCSSVNYAQSISVGSRSLKSYIKAVQKSIDEFRPDIIYAQETLPSIAALIALKLKKNQNCSLVLDFHTFSAYEYWTRLSSVNNWFQEFKQCIKTYIAQGILIFSGHPIIAAGESTPELISQWYGRTPKQISCIGNGVTEDLLNSHSLNDTDPYKQLRPAKIVVVVAPKTYGFPTNDMSVSMTIDIAKKLENQPEKIHFVVIGRNKDDIEKTFPSNISFTGFLPSRNDFITHIKYADITLLPFSKQAVAGGARNKALDYFASQKLVISTPEGLRGLEEFRHLQHLLVTDYSAEDIAQKILDVALNQAKYQPLAQAAYNLIKEKYSWNARAQSIANILLSTSNA